MADDGLEIDEIRFRADNATAPEEADDVLAEDVPALCDEVERLRSQLDDVRQLCEQLDADDWREGFAKGALEGILGLEGDDE